MTVVYSVDGIFQHNFKFNFNKTTYILKINEKKNQTGDHCRYE